MIGCLTREIARLELGPGSLTVVGVEHNDRVDPSALVDLGDAQGVGVELDGQLSTATSADPGERESIASGRDDTVDDAREADLDGGPHVGDLCGSTAPDTEIHATAAIVQGEVIAEQQGHGVPVASLEARQKPLAQTGCTVLQAAYRSTQPLEPGHR